MRVNVVCRNFEDDRVLPRFARYLRDRNGWTLTKAPVTGHDVVYLMGYFESQMCRPSWPTCPVASLFTHREEGSDSMSTSKADLWDKIAARVQLRVSMCRLYVPGLEAFGPTIQAPLPVERDRFAIATKPRSVRPVVGLSSYPSKNNRKGEDIVEAVMRSPIGGRVSWSFSGKPSSRRAIPPRQNRAHYEWKSMPAFYQSLDVLLCPSRVEGGPMPVLEALACGIPVVVPRGVGIVDELPFDVAGIYRYKKGNVGSLVEALDAAAFGVARIDREALRSAVSGHSVEAWCSAHAKGFAEAFA